MQNKKFVLTEEIINNLPIITEEELQEHSCTTEEMLESILSTVEEGLKDFDEDGNPIQTEFSK